MSNHLRGGSPELMARRVKPQGLDLWVLLLGFWAKVGIACPEIARSRNPDGLLELCGLNVESLWNVGFGQVLG